MLPANEICTSSCKSGCVTCTREPVPRTRTTGASARRPSYAHRHRCEKREAVLKKEHAKQKQTTTLDTIVASAEDSLLPGINYSLNNKRGASFVHQRVLTTFEA